MASTMANQMIPGRESTGLVGDRRTVDTTAWDLRVRRLRELLANEPVCRIAGLVERLPALPETFNKLCLAASNPNATVAQISRVIQADPAISLRLLQLANSAFFGASQRISSIPQAVSILGTELLKSLILSIHVCNMMELVPTRSFSMQNFQAYSVRVARLARHFAPSRDVADQAFTAGLLLGVGKVVFAYRDPDRFERVLARVAETGEAQHIVEQELFGTTHAETGAFLLSIWNIPFPIVECVAFHHRPSLLESTDLELMGVVHAADALVGIEYCDDPEDNLDMAFIERAGLAGCIPQWREMVVKAIS